MFLASIALITLALFPRRPGDPCVAPAAPTGTRVPVEYADGRYFAHWALKGGGSLRFFLDTGGPRDHLLADAVRRLSLSREVHRVEHDSLSWVRLPRQIAEQLSPPLRNNEWLDTARSSSDGSVRLMAAFPGSPLELLHDGDGAAGGTRDGILGPDWFGGRVWTLDYPGRRLYHHEAEKPPVLPAGCWVPLGFQVDSTGAVTSQFPRITALIDGDSVDFLFDAGATTSLTDSAWRVIEPEAGRTRAASFIVRERFERWHAKHPEWPVVERTDRRFPVRMIRVPVIEVGGQRLGPVWFSERPNAAFHDFMSRWMDRRIDGALGGSAWREVIVVLDYPRSRAAILRPPGR